MRKTEGTPAWEWYELIENYLYCTNPEFKNFISENCPSFDVDEVEDVCHTLLQLNVLAEKAMNFSIGSEDISNVNDLLPLI